MNNKNKFARLFSTVCLVNVSTLCFGWGNDGHKTVGAIADKLISGTHTVQQVSEIVHDGETLSSVSTWADCAKGYCGLLTPEMKTFVHENPDQHQYHYTDVPFQKTRYKLGGVPNPKSWTPIIYK